LLCFNFTRAVGGHRPVSLVECGVGHMRPDQFLDELADLPFPDHPVQPIVDCLVQSNRHPSVHGVPLTRYAYNVFWHVKGHASVMSKPSEGFCDRAQLLKWL
jgi:hypothetical protein